MKGRLKMAKKIINKLKDMSMDLHNLELEIFKNGIDKTTGQFNNQADQTIFTEVGRTRKQVEQLLYIIEKYGKIDK